MKSEDKYEIIRHDGVVQKVSAGSVLVSITSNAACSGCHADGYCNLSGKNEKMIDIDGSYNVVPGDTVTVLMKQSSGLTAVLLSYILPLAILIMSLSLLVSLSVPELEAGLASIAFMGLYFMGLILIRKRIKRVFTFTLKT